MKRYQRCRSTGRNKPCFLPPRYNSRYQDADGDSYGDGDFTAQACDTPEGYVGDSTDCDDGDTTVNPAATSLGRDVVLVQGVEPSFRWRAFAIELMELAQATDVSMVITLGALMADVAHSRPIPVSATSDSEDTRHRHDLEMSTYEGPTGIVGVLADAATQVGIPSVSAWAAVPHYAGHSPSPKATLALVSRLEELLDAPIEHADLDEDSRAWERGINELASSDSEVAEYVESLEEAQDTADLPEASGDAIAKEFERYLRRRGTDED